MKTSELLEREIATSPVATGISVARAETAVEIACASALATVSGLQGADVDTLLALVERVRSGQPVPGTKGAIAWSALMADLGRRSVRGVVTPRLRAGAALLTPHLVMRPVRPDDGRGKIEGCDAKGADCPAEIVAAAMAAARPTLKNEDERRTLDHLAAVLADNRRLPMTKGRATYAVILHRLGIAGRGATRCERLVTRWAPFFLLEQHESVLRDGEIVHVEQAAVRLANHIQEKHDANEPLAESCMVSGQASLTAIHEDTGIPYASLRNHRHLVDHAVSTKFVLLGPSREKDPAVAEALRALRRARLEFIDRCVRDDVALPMSRDNSNAYDFAAIAAISDVEGDDLAGDLTYTMGVYERAPLRLPAVGIGAPGSTYGQFGGELRERRSKELAGKKSRASQVAQTMEAYASFRSIIGRTLDGATISQELSSENIEKVLAEVRGKPGAVRDFTRFQTNIRIVARIHAATILDDGLGDTLGGALSVAIRRSDKSMPELATAAGLSEGIIKHLARGKASRSAAVLAALPSLETALSLRQDRLTDLPRKQIMKGGLTVGDRKIPAGFQDFVSEKWATMEDDKFGEMIAWIEDNLIRQPTPHGRAMRLAVAIGREAARIRAELGAGRPLTADVPDDDKPPFRRSLEALVAHKMTTMQSEGLLRKAKATWVDHTARMRMAMLLDLANFATDPIQAGGLGFDPATFDLAHLMNTNIAMVYVDQMAHRLVDVEWGGRDGKKRGPLFTRLHADLMILLASIFGETWGFAYQQPAMADALARPDAVAMPPILHLVDTREVQKVLPNYRPRLVAPMPRVPTDLVGLDEAAWKARSILTAARYKTLAGDIAKRAKRARDPVITIKGLVEDDNPVQLALEHLRRAADRTPSLIADPYAHHTHTRDVMTSILALLLTFRPKNMRELTSAGDGPQMWFENGLWRIEIPHTNFKNYDSAPLFADKSPFQRDIPEIPGLYELMDYYNAKSRPFLTGIQDTPNFIVDGNGNALTGLSYWRLTRNFSARHLAYNPWQERGIPDVMPFSPYSWRYIRATDIILHPVPNCNPYLEAANALQTSEAMVLRYYARVRPNARNSNQDERFRVIAQGVFRDAA